MDPYSFGKFMTVLFAVITISIKAQTEENMNKIKFNEEQLKVIHTIENMVEAFHNKDIQGVMNCYEINSEILFEPGTPVSELNEIKKQFENAFIINPVYKFFGHEVYIIGDIAVHFTPWEMNGTLPDGASINQSGLSTALLRKQPGGNWLIFFDNPHSQFLMENQLKE